MELARTSEAAASRPTGTVTFLFTDIERSTQRWEASREAMAEAVSRHDALLRAAFERRAGYVFKTLGDAFCVAFARPEDGVAAALDAQRALLGEDFSATGGLPVRLALHTGTAEERDGDYFGPAVNRVARLLAVGHGGQILVSGTAADLLQGVMPAQTSLRDLGRHQLRDLTRPEQVYQVLADGLPERFPPLLSLDVLPNNLPRQSTPLIGRDDVLAKIKSMLGQSNLVTLVGTGGVGKTRAALQAGAELLDGSGGGVWFIDLAPLKEPHEVAGEIATVLSLQSQDDSPPIERIVRFLRDRSPLLIVDNCEHLVAEASRVIARILKDCPNVVILATSREGLNVRGEQVYRMPSLSVPHVDAGSSIDDALAHGAIALFVDRASAADARFALTEENLPVIADICRRLDGIALAIELAAARVKILNPRQIAQRLDERFRILTGGDRTALPRQQTMLAAIEWSYALLSEDEKRIFRRLSVFRGGWTLEAAAAIAGGDELDEYAVFDVLASLVEKSLVVVEYNESSQRYSFLESIRQFARERLIDAVEQESISKRHAGYFKERAAQNVALWERDDELAYVAACKSELENSRAAIEWGLKDDRDVHLAAFVTESLYGYFLFQDLVEGRRRVDIAHARLARERDPALHLKLSLARTRVWVGAGDVMPLRPLILSALEEARACGDPRQLARAVFYLGEHQHEEDPDRAEAAFREAHDLASSIGDSLRAASALAGLAAVYRARGEHARARATRNESLAHYARTRALHNRVIGITTSAAWEHEDGDYAKAMELITEARHLCPPSATIIPLVNDRTARIAAELGDLEEARRYAALALKGTASMPGFLVTTVLTSAFVLARLERWERSARVLGWAAGHATGESVIRGYDLFIEQRTRTAIEAALGADTAAALAAKGAAMSESDILAEATGGQGGI